MAKQFVTTLITDLDNTLFDWVDIWYKSFSAMLAVIERVSGLPRETLLPEIKAVHEQHGTSEYAFLIQELPCLRALHPGVDLVAIYRPAIDAFRIARDEALRLYPGVSETLANLKGKGVTIVGYTESMAFYSNYRVRKLGLDGQLDLLYSPPDHELPQNLSPEDIRKYPASHYSLDKTDHRFTPKGELKPSPRILQEIVAAVSAEPERCVYIGDSLMKDITMAQESGITDILAGYGKASHREEYELLRAVTHWPTTEVRRERAISEDQVRPSHVLESSFSELTALFDFGRRG